VVRSTRKGFLWDRRFFEENTLKKCGQVEVWSEVDILEFTDNCLYYYQAIKLHDKEIIRNFYITFVQNIWSSENEP